jgi:hypothetical protein
VEQVWAEVCGIWGEGEVWWGELLVDLADIIGEKLKKFDNKIKKTVLSARFKEGL